MRAKMMRVKRRGFTLIELLVASVLTIIVMTAIFLLFQSMSGIFYVHTQTGEMRSSTRFAMQMIGSEVQRAGHLASPSVNDDNFVCPKPFFAGLGAEDLNAILIDDGVDAAEVLIALMESRTSTFYQTG